MPTLDSDFLNRLSRYRTLQNLIFCPSLVEVLSSASPLHAPFASRTRLFLGFQPFSTCLNVFLAMVDLAEQNGQDSVDERSDVHEVGPRGGESFRGDEVKDKQDASNQHGDAEKGEDETQDEADEDDAIQLTKLTANVRDQDDLERDIGRQADQMLVDQADERDNKRLEKTSQEKEYGTICIWTLLMHSNRSI